MIRMSQIKKKYIKERLNFKRDLKIACKSNSALCMAIIKTYSAHHNKHLIMKIWQFLGFNHREAYKDCCKDLVGKMLCGEDEIFHTLYFTNKELRDKYYRKIPGCYAMGDALGIAYQVMRENKKGLGD